MTSVLPRPLVGQRASTVDGDAPRAGDVPARAARSAEPDVVAVAFQPGADASELVASDVVVPDVVVSDVVMSGVVEDQAMAKAERQLSERQRSMIVFERQWWRHAGSKEQAIREQFDLSATRYYQMLNQLLDRPEALAFDPLVVGRLRRLRATRARTRMAH
jgi:uncharacterized protein DUF3263